MQCQQHADADEACRNWASEGCTWWLCFSSPTLREGCEESGASVTTCAPKKVLLHQIPSGVPCFRECVSAGVTGAMLKGFMRQGTQWRASFKPLLSALSLLCDTRRHDRYCGMSHLRRLDFFLRRAALLFSTPLGFLTAGSTSLPSLPSGLPSWWFTALAPPAAVRGIDLQGAQCKLMPRILWHTAMHADCLRGFDPANAFPPAAVTAIGLSEQAPPTLSALCSAAFSPL